MRAWVVVLASFACLLLVSCEPKFDNPTQMVVVKECGRVWHHVQASSSGDFRRAVRLDCGFLRPHHERTEAVTVGL
jgi:hypothetical protein